MRPFYAIRAWFRRLLYFLTFRREDSILRDIERRLNRIEGKLALTPIALPAPRRPLSMTGWHVWMADGKEYDSVSTKPANIPAVGVQAVMVRRSDETKLFLRHAKWYIWQENKVLATTDLSTITVRKEAQVKEGTRIPDEDFKRLMQRTM